MGQEPAQSSVIFAPKFKAKASLGSGIWTPTNQSPTSSKTNLSEEILKNTPVIPVTPPPPPAQPIWTPQPTSPTNQRKEFRPVRFESPTLPRRYVLQQNSADTNVQPPWSNATNPIQNCSQALPTLPRSANSCLNLSTPNTTVSSSTTYCDSSHCGDPAYASSLDYAPFPTTSVSDKIKTFERSASASELYCPTARRLLSTSPVTYKPNEITDYEIRYKCPRGRYQHYKTNGYVSEPEPNYDSDYSAVKYRTLDRRRLQSSSSASNVRNPGNFRQDEAFYGTMPNPIKSGQSYYKNQPGRIEDYTTGHSSVSEKEKKEWWDEVMDIFNGQHLEQAKLSPHYTEGNLSRALAKESGYASDSNLVFRRKEVPLGNSLSPVERKEAYKSLQAGGEPPLFGFRKPAPEKPKEYIKQFEYLQITPTLTKIRIHNRGIVQNTQRNKRVATEIPKKLKAKPNQKTNTLEAVSNSEMFNPFSKTMPSFISINQQLTSSNSPPPTPPNRKSSRTRTTLKVTTASDIIKRPTSASSSRHEQCFQTPKSPTLNKFATFTVRKNVRREPLCRSKSAGAIAALMGPRFKGERSSGSRDIERLSRVQQATRLDSINPTRQSPSRISTLRHPSRSPVAFGRSISKERTFAEEKKRLEALLPIGRTNFEASTNILRDPSLKSPDEVKQAVRSYATCPTHSRSKSVPRAISPSRYPNFSVNTTTRHSMCFPQVPETKQFTLSNKLEVSPVHIKALTSKSESINTRPIERNLSLKTFPKSFSTASLTRTSSTFSVDSTAPKLKLSSDAKPKKMAAASKSIRSSIKDCTKAVRRSALKPSANPISGSKSGSNIKESVVRTLPQKDVSATVLFKQKGQTPPNKPIYSSHYFKETSPTPDLANGESSLPTSVHEKTRFWNTYNENLGPSTALVDQKYLSFNQSRSLSPNYEWRSGFLSHEYLKDMSLEDADDGSEFGAGGTEDLVWRIEQRSKKGTLSKTPQQVSDIARPESPAPSRLRREFSPTREIRIPQATREVRSPSRRRIDSLRPSNKFNASNVIRASSLSSADDRSKRGLYLCGELAHSATSLSSTERHSPTCRYRNNSERFNDLNRFYSTLERVGQLERATSATNLKPIRREGESLEFEEWRRIRHHERAEKELSYLVEKLKQDQLEKDFLFRLKDVDDVKWNEDKDFGLRSKDKSVEDLRENFEKKIKRDWFDWAKEQELELKKDIFKPYWRSNTVADLASSMEIKYNPDSGSFAVQQKSKPRDEQEQTSLSNRLVSTLSKDQLLKISHQLNEIYSPEYQQPSNVDVREDYVVTVNRESKVGSEPNKLKVRCNSTITKEDLIAPVMRRKQAANKLMSFKQEKAANQKHSTTNREEKISARSSSPVFLARETRGAIAAKNANVTYIQSAPELNIPAPPPPPLPPKNFYQTINVSTLIGENSASSAIPKEASDKISQKIQYFEERKFDEPSKTIYHAREDSSPDEEEIMRVVEENIKKRARNETNFNHKDLSSSLTDLQEMFGEKQSSRVNFPMAPPPPQPPDEIKDSTIHSFMSDIEETLYEEHNSSYSQDGDSAENIDRYFRSCSASPQSHASSYLQRVHTGEVQKIKDKFESLGGSTKNNFFGVGPLRKVRSDPELSNINSGLKDAFKTIIKIDETGDVSWIKHNFELRNKFLSSNYTSRRRSRGRKLISPVPRKDRFMPHIDIISKTAALKKDVCKKIKSPSASPTRSKLETNGSPLIKQQIFHSSPDVRDTKDISPHLTASWIAHKYPKQVDNTLTPLEKRDNTEPPNGRVMEVKRCLKKLERRRANSTSPPRPTKSIKHRQCTELNAVLKPYYDIFANQNFDPKKHQPKARYVPFETKTNFWNKSTVHSSCSGTCSSIKKTTAVKFQGSYRRENHI